MSNTPPDDPRILKLGSVEVLPKNLVDASIHVDADGYVGQIRALGIKLMDQVSRARIGQEKPPHLLVADHAKNAGDVIAVPVMKETEHTIAIDWYNEGRSAKVNLAKLLTLKAITIPDDTRMVIQLYAETDAKLGPCIGLKLMAAEFVARQKGASRSGTES